ncbi:aminopeptidase A isoform X2 [Arctopsyche grandis]|uniref:aminopeptidase A isoform X2 n=1 Tax=Arctopsyche grandis TaxID=121162 RepID=UPI00406D87C9
MALKVREDKPATVAPLRRERRRAKDGGPIVTLGVVVVLSFASIMSAVTCQMTSANFRLDERVRPLAYRLRLHPDLKTGLFSGHVDIDLEIDGRPGRHLRLHSANLTVSSARLTNGSGQIAVSEIRSLPVQTLELQLDEELESGRHTLHLEFSGDLRNRIVGIYRSTYRDAGGRDRVIATSKFEPTYARQAFPCFDEPAMKAKFTVELIAPPDYIALSNMEESDNIIQSDGNHLIKFTESVPMSTYLACFIVCDFKFKNKTVANINGTFPFKVYATADQLDKVDFSLDVGVAVTEYYIQYFGIDYPLPKLDMIAIPDFVSGAMEHWGLVTYRETNLLHSDSTTSPANKQNIARVVAHEISHMWFGNLVTMKWWNDLWLNEGFASYMQYKALDVLHPEWKMLDQFLTSNTHSILSLDATLNSHPIVQTVDTPDEITAIFDSVTYNKGAAIIRMLEEFIGEDKFREGISAYLKKHKYQNTVTQDLLDELEKVFDNTAVAPQTVTYIMDTWTKQMGFPVVHIKYNTAKSGYELTQQRFLADPDTKPESPSQFHDKWSIHVTYLSKDKSTGSVWFLDNQDNALIEKPQGSILKLNNDQIGYYRVNYEESMWNDIKNELKNLTTSVLTPSDRTNIINDVFTLAQAKVNSYNLALDISTYLKIEKEYVPWSAASSQFSSLKTIMSNSNAYIEFRKFVRGLLMDVYDEMTKITETDDQVERLLQSTIYNLACSMGHSPCLQVAETTFSKWLKSTTDTIDPNLRNTFYYYGVQQTGENEWLALWDIFVLEDDAQEKSKLMQALAASTDQAILKRYLNLAWDDRYIRSQDHLSVIQYISSNPVGTSLVWDHVRENWPKLVEKFTLNSRTLGTMIPAITRSFATELKLQEMDVFFTQYPNAGAGETARKQARENVKNNIKWLATHEETVRLWLESQEQTKTSK